MNSANTSLKIACVLIVVLSHSSRGFSQEETTGDPLARALEGQLKPTVEVLLDHYRTKRTYKNADFPMKAEAFDTFKQTMSAELARSLGIEAWVVRSPTGKRSRLGNLYEDRVVETTTLHGVRVEIHAVAIKPTGLIVPMTVCLPEGKRAESVAGVCVFSGHTTHGLHDLVLNLDSYQQGVAIRLAQAGFATIAVEKIDTGYLSRDGAKGNDENAAATLMLSWGNVLRSHQLRACIAATEILAEHSRVDETRIGATGVSLGGWLTVQTALLDDRIRAVADFGRKTRSVGTDVQSGAYQGQRDLCHIIPGMLKLSDRNLMPVALAPLPMLAGHGRADTGSHQEHAANFRQICERQYAVLDAEDKYSYLIHSGGDVMPSREVVAWFKKQFEQAP